MARVQVANPAPNRAKRKKGDKMAATAKKKKKRRAKKRAAASNPTKKRKRAKRRAASNPKKRRSAHRRKRRHSASNPSRKRRRARRANPKRRAAGSSPRKRRRKHNPHRARRKRRHRRNPGLPLWAVIPLAGLAGLATYAVVSDGSFALTQRLDPSLDTLERNRLIFAGLSTAAGIGVSFVSPVFGVSLILAGVVAGVGHKASQALGKVLDKPSAVPEKKISGVYEDNQRQLMGGVYQGGQRQLMGGVYQGGQRQLMGAAVRNGRMVYPQSYARG